MTEFEILNERECWLLLASANLGRFAVVVDHYPVVLPVNYLLDGSVIVFRTAPGTKLDASQHSNVAFEVDHVEADGQSGWSVLVRGSVDHMGTSIEERDRLDHLDTHPLAPGDKPALVRIVADRVTGRRLRFDEQLPAFDPHGYL